jgi:hypothetical protein
MEIVTGRNHDVFIWKYSQAGSTGSGGYFKQGAEKKKEA